MIVRTPSELGILIRERRRALGLGQQELATKVGVSRLWVIEIEKGKPRAEVGLVMRALIALELDLSVRPAAAPPGKRRAGAISVPDIDAIVRAARKRP